MIWPMESIDEKLRVPEKVRISVETIRVEVASIIVDYDVGC